MEATIVILGLYRDVGIMEKKMETTVVYWGYIGTLIKAIRENIKYPKGLPR